MLLVALTGGIGSGKSLAGEYLASLGAIVVDSDHLAREVVERGEPAFDEILARFGDRVISDGQLDRKALAEIVFDDQIARRDLEAIIHPRIREAFTTIVDSAAPDAVIVNLIPLLVETGGMDRFQYIISIAASTSLRRERCIARGMKSYEFDKRLTSQSSDEERARVSDKVIDNEGSPDDLLRAIEKLWSETLLPLAKAR